MHLSAITIDGEAFPGTDNYPFNLAILRNTKTVAFRSPVTYFIGENGSGKSTLLTAIARAAGIHIWDSPHAPLVANRHADTLHRYVSVDWRDGTTPGAFFASDMFRHFSLLLDEWAKTDPGLLEYFGGSSLMAMSHGQSTMAFFESRFRIRGLYLLDEPECALSPRRLIEFLGIIHRAAATGEAQFIIATHSPILLALPGAVILSFDSPAIREIAYEDTDHVRAYRSFLADPQGYLRERGAIIE
ncbi:MAG TPA: AAA family ATPase [Spirochaetota bacterium]|nr:AAA family ATPase [Spirochaetota bacterium]HNT11624.1 AAA family ATPase [Spirochaetota bacterium]